jgi:uncharacterized protein YjiS (DUF1127 family)
MAAFAAPAIVQVQHRRRSWAGPAVRGDVIRREDSVMAHTFEPARVTLAATVRRLEHAWQRHRARAAVFRHTVDELTALSDRELGDLGLARCDIGRVARAEADKL